MGSRIWKIGFSGEGRPRDVFYVAGGEGVANDVDALGLGLGVSVNASVESAIGESSSSLWSLERLRYDDDKEEAARQLDAVMQKKLRFVFHE